MEKELRESNQKQVDSLKNELKDLMDLFDSSKSESKNLNDLLKFEASKNEKQKVIAENMSQKT